MCRVFYKINICCLKNIYYNHLIKTVSLLTYIHINMYGCMYDVCVICTYRSSIDHYHCLGFFINLFINIEWYLVKPCQQNACKSYFSDFGWLVCMSSTKAIEKSAFSIPMSSHNIVLPVLSKLEVCARC